MAAGTRKSDDGDDAALAEWQRRGHRHGGEGPTRDSDAAAPDDHDADTVMDEAELDAVTRLLGFLRSSDDE